MRKEKMTALIVILAVALIGCGAFIYKTVRFGEHQLTADEKAAAEITEELTKERSDDERDFVIDVVSVPDVGGADVGTTPDSTSEEVQKEEVNAVDSEADRFITETPEVYEDYKAEEEVHQADSKWQNGEYQFTSDEVWEMTRIVYLENGITYPECTYKTVYLTACVILNRLYDWSECDTIYDVIWQGGQYSTADRYHDYNGAELGSSNPDGWAISEEAVWDAIANTDRNPHFQSMSAQGEIYYTDPTTGEVFCY